MLHHFRGKWGPSLKIEHSEILLLVVAVAKYEKCMKKKITVVPTVAMTEAAW